MPLVIIQIVNTRYSQIGDQSEEEDEGGDGMDNMDDIEGDSGLNPFQRRKR